MALSGARTMVETSVELSKVAFYVITLLLALAFIQYSLINYNTGELWYPFVAGPLMGISFLLLVAITAFGGDYQLAALLNILFIVLTLTAYAVTFETSSIIDYEYVAFMLSLNLLLVVYMDRKEGSVDLAPMFLRLSLLVTYVPFLLFVLLAFKYGYYYSYLAMIMALILSLSNFLLLIPTFTQSLLQTLVLESFVMFVFLIYVLASSPIGPDVCEWIIRATLLSSYLTLLWTAFRSRWE